MAEDLSALGSIYKDAMRDLHARGINQWDEQYPVSHLPEDLANGELYVITGDGMLIGAVALNERADEWHVGLKWRGADERAMYVHRLVIAIGARGGGAGTQFMRWAHDFARGTGCRWMRLDTNTANSAATGLYHHLGYHDVGLLADYPDYIAMDYDLSSL